MEPDSVIEDKTIELMTSLRRKTHSNPLSFWIGGSEAQKQSFSIHFVVANAYFDLQEQSGTALSIILP
ncbi:F-box/WD repeat-containing protein 11 [Grus japonensis]|uniref:F-box/WD repeat-containing protein 11 n=1 Tax=Grus japonensis TaxID=30415 RepID=A0ABC9XFF6_GRUJA